MQDVTVVYHAESGEPRMVIVGEHDLSDPAWKPAGHGHIYIPHEDYRKIKHHDLLAHIKTKIKESS